MSLGYMGVNVWKGAVDEGVVQGHERRGNCKRSA